MFESSIDYRWYQIIRETRMLIMVGINGGVRWHVFCLNSSSWDGPIRLKLSGCCQDIWKNAYL